MPIHIDHLQRFIGFSLANALKGDEIPVLIRASMTSDDPLFHVLMEEVSPYVFGQTRILQDAVVAFLIVLHSDDSADLYVNGELESSLEIRVRRSVEAGELVRANDIADVRRVTFPSIKLQATDRFIYCTKVDWKFGLCFDLRDSGSLDIAAVEIELGALHRRLMYEHVYKTLESAAHFDSILADGWFPFVEMLPSEFRLLGKAYVDRFNLQKRIEVVVDAVNAERIRRLAGRWWQNPLFAGKRKLLEAGVEAYLRQTDDGYIHCIKTLGTEIEGLLRAQHVKDSGKALKLHTADLIQHIIDKQRGQAGGEMSLLLPAAFLRYLKEVIYRGFDVASGDQVMSRHTAAHGVARPEDYTKARALQMILTVDQLSYFSQ